MRNASAVPAAWTWWPPAVAGSGTFMSALDGLCLALRP